jgi:hypothetical protein
MGWIGKEIGLVSGGIRPIALVVKSRGKGLLTLVSQVRILPGPPTKLQVDGLVNLCSAYLHDARAALRPHPGRTRGAKRLVPGVRSRRSSS